MIVVCFRGGLGNQLYQYAFCSYLSQKANLGLGINDWFYSDGNRINRTRSLGILNLSCSFEAVFHENWVASSPMVHDGKILKYISDEDVSMSGLITDATNGEIASGALTGWWQEHVSYLDDKELRKTLIRDFTPKEVFSSPAFDEYRRMISAVENSVAVHVRRGDYLKLKHLFKTLGKSYYDAAIGRIRDIVEKPKFFVFSDDVAHVKAENIFDGGVTYVETDSLLQDFQLFRSCRHSIIANSTYSWWGAYLNENPEKIVVIPEIYFTDQKWQEKHEAQPKALSGWEIV